MREIKFRQHNKNNRQKNYWGFIDGIWINPIQQDNFTKPEESDEFTGLKDKNGKEIYEGDIVQEKPMKAKVIELTCGGLAVPIDIAEYEVIGNIYENPNLLQ